MEKEVLYRFFDDESSIEEQKMVLDWLDADPMHHKEMLQERRVFDALLLHAKPARKAKGMVIPRWAGELLKYAAVIAIVLITGQQYLSYQNDQLLQAYNTIAVPAGQHVDVTLPDGTKVSLNALSELKYPTFFVGEKRNVQLSGEAFFDVAHNKALPFVVETYKCHVEVLGTQFNVEARKLSDELIVSLVKGSVKVTDNLDPSHNVILNPSEQAAYSNNRLHVGVIPNGESFLWRSGLIAFRDMSFHALISEFEKYYGVTINVHRNDLSERRFTGKIRISEGIDHALRVLQLSADFKAVRSETSDIIIIK